jgi:hypothetical protein
MAIIAFMASQRSVMRDIIDGSVGIIFIIMPSFVISQDTLHIMGVMPFIIIGIIMPMPCMPMGMPIMPPIIGIMPMPFIGIMPMPLMPFIMGNVPMPFIICMLVEPPIIPIGIIGAFIIGIWFIAFMVSSIDSSAGRRSGLGCPGEKLSVLGSLPQGSSVLSALFRLP